MAHENAASASKTEEFIKGLEGVVAAETHITSLDGRRGVMLYRGYNAVDLAAQTSFEEVVHLLWEGELPTRKVLEPFSRAFVESRAVPGEVIDLMRRLPAKAHPMGVLRTAVSALGVFDPEAADNTPESHRRKAVRLVARMATLTAAWDRIRKGLPLVEPDPALSHAANFIYMVTGQKPDALSARALDMYLVLLADHDLNASTFAARIAVSTQSDVYSAVTGAIGVLKGPLHGGANEKAMEMFIDIGDESRVEGYIVKALAEKRKIMGFGHRVYKVEDPRSKPLKEMLRALSEHKGKMTWYNISVKVAEEVHRHKNINTNVDFYSASLLYLLNIPTDLFTPLFAVARVAGWSAHIFEQWNDNRLIRPLTHYLGPSPRAVVPIDQRR
jgi:citrate synthase